MENNDSKVLNANPIYGRSIHEGSAEGEVLVLDEPLSLWGGIELESGTICDTSHPQHGKSIKNRILLMESGRGSSSSSSALVECAYRKTAPKGIIMIHSDSILAIGAFVAADLYSIKIPVVTVYEMDWSKLLESKYLTIKATEDNAQIQLISRNVV